MACLDERRIALGYSRAMLFARFEDALRRLDAWQSHGAARMRFDRVFNPNLRLPTSEVTRMALAIALNLTLPELEKLLQLPGQKAGRKPPPRPLNGQKAKAASRNRAAKRNGRRR